jgi:hypothetical protein
MSTETSPTILDVGLKGDDEGMSDSMEVVVVKGVEPPKKTSEAPAPAPAAPASNGYVHLHIDGSCGHLSA